ncbi:putative uncharacterized protein [Bacteroides sp. CAG:598]|uniref:DUF5683 domain-containing protein n=1 Tax=Bacteroides togonis TaxID=1917883 RepID=UPI0003395628|nr:DUF5683 domain-containing protein [Bacteroides togonis]MBV8039227.1 hypothetical protein [Caecibacteroides pullorum]MDC6280658.1 DUF5683 domain-containing protein [Caecibacteroides pullorum]CCX61178.1 putative uncharacterized protein [Bacteroides sp. CAG:598]
MTRRRLKYQILTALLLCFLQAAGIVVYGQNRPRAALRRSHELQADTTHKTLSPQQQALKADTLDALAKATADSIANENKKKMLELTASPDIKQEKDPTDSLSRELKRKQWVPNPTKATWLALVIPGGGQIYNRKYWKLPIVYGGFAGCAYALTWNGKMYKDYQAAYVDAVNEKWDSSSITDLLPPGYIDRVSHSQITETLRKRKDTYRRWRDLSIFAFIGVYLISVVDAYVDAELSNFDIGPDLSMKVEPTLINNQTGGYYNPATLKDKSVGVQCSFRF